MKKKTILFFCTILIIGVIYWKFQPKIKAFLFERHAIEWSRDVKIKFEDFKQKPDLSSNKTTNYFIGIQLWSMNVIDAQAKTYFDKNQSWVKDTSSFDFSGSLKIIKLDFDLLESYTRRINREIDKIRYDENVVFSDIENLSLKIYQEYERKQEEFRKINMTLDEKEKYLRPIINDLLEEQD